MELDKAIKERQSIRKFTSKKPSWKKIIECIESMRYAPMAGNNFTLKLIVVDDAETIAKIAKASQQSFISKSHYVVVACSNSSLPTNAYDKKGENYVRQQAGAAIQNFLLKIQETGLSTCWVGSFVEEQIKRELKIPAKIQVEAIFPIGYTALKPRKRLRIDLETFLYFNKYGNKKLNKKPERSGA
jgi:nitroreductase